MRTVSETLLEMEGFNYRAGEQDTGTVNTGAGLAKAFERAGLPVVWAWATHFNFPRKIVRVLCGYFEHQRRVQSERLAAEPLQTLTATLFGSNWSCLLLHICVARRAAKGIMKVYPEAEGAG